METITMNAEDESGVRRSYRKRSANKHYQDFDVQFSAVVKHRKGDIRDVKSTEIIPKKLTTLSTRLSKDGLLMRDEKEVALLKDSASYRKANCATRTSKESQRKRRRRNTSLWLHRPKGVKHKKTDDKADEKISTTKDNQSPSGSNENTEVKIEYEELQEDEKQLAKAENHLHLVTDKAAFSILTRPDNNESYVEMKSVAYEHDEVDAEKGKAEIYTCMDSDSISVHNFVQLSIMTDENTKEIIKESSCGNVDENCEKIVSNLDDKLIIATSDKAALKCPSGSEETCSSKVDHDDVELNSTLDERTQYKVNLGAMHSSSPEHTYTRIVPADDSIMNETKLHLFVQEAEAVEDNLMQDDCMQADALQPSSVAVSYGNFSTNLSDPESRLVSTQASETIMSGHVDRGTEIQNNDTPCPLSFDGSESKKESIQSTEAIEADVGETEVQIVDPPCDNIVQLAVENKGEPRLVTCSYRTLIKMPGKTVESDTAHSFLGLQPAILMEEGSTNEDKVSIEVKQEFHGESDDRVDQEGIKSDHVAEQGNDLLELCGKKSSVNDACLILQLPNSEELISCKFCSYTTKKRSNWYKHRRHHLGLRNYFCTTCSYRATTASNLRRHMEIHSDSRPFACSSCSQTFRQKIHLQRHIKYKHELKEVACPKCEYRCASETPDLKVHIQRKHTKKDPAKYANSYLCHQCNFVADQEKDLKQHMKFHRPGPEVKLFCEYCSFVADCKSRLNRHMLIHTKEKPHSCPECDYCARQKEHLQRHMQVKHNASVKNTHADTMASAKNKVASHEKTKTKQSRRKYAPSDFSSIEKAFACVHCNLKFVKAISLFKHLQGQHGVEYSEEKGWICVVCGYKAPSKHSLLVHMRQHNPGRLHNIVPDKEEGNIYMCAECNHIDQDRAAVLAHVTEQHLAGDTDTYPDCTIMVVRVNSEDDPEVSDAVTTITSSMENNVQEANESKQVDLITLEDKAVTEAEESSGIVSCVETLDDNIENSTKTLSVNVIDDLESKTECDTGSNGGNAESMHVIDVEEGKSIHISEESEEGEGQSTKMQLTEWQLLQLAAADLVEINGETYQVQVIKC